MEFVKCMNDGCPRSSTCLRFTSRPNDFFQSYKTFSPDSTGACRWFVPLEISYPAKGDSACSTTT